MTLPRKRPQGKNYMHLTRNRKSPKGRILGEGPGGPIVTFDAVELLEWCQSQLPEAERAVMPDHRVVSFTIEKVLHESSATVLGEHLDEAMILVETVIAQALRGMGMDNGAVDAAVTVRPASVVDRAKINAAMLRANSELPPNRLLPQTNPWEDSK